MFPCVGPVVEIDFASVGTGREALALELIEKVMVVPDLVAVPDVDEAVSQFGMLLIEYLTEPLEAVSVYLNVDGENGPP